MSGYSDNDRPRYRRDRRPPRYYDSDSDSIDDYRPPKPRRERPRAERDEPPTEPAPAPAPRRPSILIDPDETASQRARRRPRSHSNVRVRASSDESDYYDRSRAPPDRAPRLARASRHDLERKDSHENRQFRKKRDGYESEEGQILRKAKMPSAEPRPRRGYEDDDRPDEGYERRYKSDRPPREPRDDMSLPLRGKPRDPAEASLAGAAGGAAGAVAGNPNLQRRRTYKDSTRDRPRYDDYDEPPRREDPRYLSRPKPTYDERDRGYRSDAAPPRRRERRRDDYDDYDDYDHRRKPDEGGYRSDRSAGKPQRPRPQDYYSDYRDDRVQRSDPRQRRDRDRQRYKDDDRYRDYDKRRSGDYDRERPRSSKRGATGWQKEASAAFMTYAMPVIKKEGGRYVKKELQKLLAKQAGGA